MTGPELPPPLPSSSAREEAAASSSPPRASSSRGAAWLLVVLWVTPLLYLLSVPLLSIWSEEYGGSTGTVPPWLQQYSEPANWLYYNTPLKAPLEAYRSFCWRVYEAFQE